jgi:hypothetical protein
MMMCGGISWDAAGPATRALTLAFLSALHAHQSIMQILLILKAW